MTVQRLVTHKENVQGSYYMDSTWLYSAIAKLNMIIKAKEPSILWNYLALICKAETPYLPPFYLNLFTISLVTTNHIKSFHMLSSKHIVIQQYSMFTVSLVTYKSAWEVPPDSILGSRQTLPHDLCHSSPSVHDLCCQGGYTAALTLKIFHILLLFWVDYF